MLYNPLYGKATSIPLIAALLAFLRPYYPLFVTKVVDSLLEEVISGLENNVAS